MFVRALGAHAQLQVHKSCNSRIGGKVEGRLQRPGEQLNLKLLRARIDGVADSDFEFNLDTGEFRWHRPVLKQTVGAEEHFTVRGPESQVRQIVERQMASFGLSPEDVEPTLASAVPSEPVEGTATLIFDLALARRLAAKIAVGALARADMAEAWGPLGDRLRDVLWQRVSLIRPVPVDALSAFETLVVGTEPFLPSARSGGVDGANERPPSRVILVPFGEETLLFVFLGRLLLSFGGFCVSAAFPPAHGLPVVIVDNPSGGVSVRFLAEELARAAAALAPDTSQRG